MAAAAYKKRAEKGAKKGPLYGRFWAYIRQLNSDYTLSILRTCLEYAYIISKIAKNLV
jgi:hypothetical protein